VGGKDVRFKKRKGAPPPPTLKEEGEKGSRRGRKSVCQVQNAYESKKGTNQRVESIVNAGRERRIRITTQMRKWGRLNG